MTSQAKIEANRRNAQKSTGPKTPEGKARASLNALKHGIRARVILEQLQRTPVWDEDPQEFADLVQSLVDHFQPQGPCEEMCVEDIAINYWRLHRLARAETGHIAAAQALVVEFEGGHNPRLRARTAIPEFDILESLTRYDTTIRRRIDRSLDTLIRLQDRRLKEVVDSDIEMNPPRLQEVVSSHQPASQPRRANPVETRHVASLPLVPPPVSPDPETIAPAIAEKHSNTKPPDVHQRIQPHAPEPGPAAPTDNPTFRAPAENTDLREQTQAAQTDVEAPFPIEPAVFAAARENSDLRKRSHNHVESPNRNDRSDAIGQAQLAP